MMTEQKDKKYRRIISTAATQTISIIGEELDGTPLVHDYAGKTVEACSTTEAVSLGLTAKKLFDFILMLLTKYNNNKESWTNGTLHFMLEDYTRLMGYSDNRQSRSRCFNTICEDIAKFGSIKLRQDSGPWFGLVDGEHFLSDTSDEQVKKAVIAGKTYFEVRMQKEFMEHLREHGHIVPFLLELFPWPGRNENAYALAKRMILHKNINSRTKLAPDKHCKLKVSTLLDCCPNKSNQHSGNVRRTFELALNFLSSSSDGFGPLIDWNYIVNGKPCQPKDVSVSHDDWQNLVVEFAFQDQYTKTEYADRNDLDVAQRRFFDNEKAKQRDESKLMRKKKTDPELHTPNAFIQHQANNAPGSDIELTWRRFESFVCEQIWLARKAPSKFIRNLRDGDGYLEFRDLTFPMELVMDQRKKLSLAGCATESMPRLLWDQGFEEEERVLVVARWFGGNGPYAQIGILKSPDDVLQDCGSKKLIKREYKEHVYYFGRLFDILTAMFDADLLPRWERKSKRLGDDESEQDSLAERGDNDVQDEPNERNERKAVTTMRMVHPRLSKCEHNIFWNTYAQECAFIRQRPNIPKYVQTTCNKLAEKYPDPVEAEMFIRAQFVMKVEDMRYTIPTVAMGFKDLVNPRHDKAYEQYRQDSAERIDLLLKVAADWVADVNLNAATSSPLARFLRDGVDSPEKVQDAVVVDCLHWPALTDVLEITEYMEDRLRFYKEEVRQSE